VLFRSINRVIRHIKPITQKRKHWHIDYFLADEGVKVDRIYIIPGREKYECDIRNILFSHAHGEIRNFGCSDCYCSSHLLYFGKEFFI
jgi:Uri superfamily endonuclease